MEDEEGLISVEEWIETMQDVLDLRDISWYDLQPQLAPTIPANNGGGEEKIDWREFLIDNTTGIMATLEDDHFSTLVDHKDKILEIFEYLDVDQNGVVDKSEFKAGAHILNKHLSPDQQITDLDGLFAKFDSDDNGFIGLKEFREVLSHSEMLSNVVDTVGHHEMGVLEQNHEMVRMAFDFLDRDGSGSINYDKFQQGIQLLNQQLGEHHQLENTRELFNLLDADGSGSISLNEFHRIFSR
mgnify:CR=1 FL=1